MSITTLSNPRVAALLASFCGLLWGSAYPGIKSGYEFFAIDGADTPSKLLFAGIRFTLAGLLVLLWARTQRVPIKVGVKTVGSILLLGLSQTTLHYYLFYLGVAQVSGAKGSITNSTGVFFSAILAHLVYKNDKLSFQKIGGILLGFLGVIAVNFTPDLGFEFSLVGEGYIVIAALLLALTTMLARRLTKTLDPAWVTGSQLSIGGLVLIVLGLAGGSPGLQAPVQGWLVLGYLALLSALAFTIWTNLLKYNKVSSITVFNFMIPVSGALLSAIFLGESLGEWRYLIALPAVAFGIYLVNRSSTQTSNS
ncbi:MAG: DMT family transporter [Spirochaetales bacterium]|nr:DMT family transporter [Spirochaetales bacterium]